MPPRRCGWDNPSISRSSSALVPLASASNIQGRRLTPCLDRSPGAAIPVRPLSVASRHMTTGWSGLGGGKRLLLRLCVLALTLAVLGLPIAGLFKYVLLLALTVAVFAGSIRTQLKRWFAAIGIGVVVVA